VTVLKDGPTCSYYSSEKLQKAKGTSDAYNLFYVKQSCLRDSIKEKFSLKNTVVVDKGAIRRAKAKREEKYGQELE